MEGGSECRVRVLFDSGSQRTYVTEAVRKLLHLKFCRKERFILNTFGQVSSTLKMLDVVQLCVKHKDFSSSTFIEALVVPSICSPLSGQDISFASSEFSHLSNLELADSNEYSSDVSVDVLVGLDYYHQFISGKITMGELGDSGPVALESVLGWILSGPLCNSRDVSVHCNYVHTMRCSAQESSSLTDILDRFWKVEDVNTKEDVTRSK